MNAFTTHLQPVPHFVHPQMGLFAVILLAPLLNLPHRVTGMLTRSPACTQQCSPSSSQHWTASSQPPAAPWPQQPQQQQALHGSSTRGLCRQHMWRLAWSCAGCQSCCWWQVKLQQLVTVAVQYTLQGSGLGNKVPTYGTRQRAKLVRVPVGRYSQSLAWQRCATRKGARGSWRVAA